MLRRRDRFWGCGCWVGLLCETMAGFHTAAPPSSHCAGKSDVLGVSCGLLVFCVLFFGGGGERGARGQGSIQRLSAGKLLLL